MRRGSRFHHLDYLIRFFASAVEPSTAWKVGARHIATLSHTQRRFQGLRNFGSRKHSRETPGPPLNRIWAFPLSVILDLDTSLKILKWSSSRVVCGNGDGTADLTVQSRGNMSVMDFVAVQCPLASKSHSGGSLFVLWKVSNID